MKKILISLPDKLVDRLDKKAKDLEMTRSQLIRDLLEKAEN